MLTQLQESFIKRKIIFFYPVLKSLNILSNFIISTEINHFEHLLLLNDNDIWLTNFIFHLWKIKKL